MTLLNISSATILISLFELIIFHLSRLLSAIFRKPLLTLLWNSIGSFSNLVPLLSLIESLIIDLSRLMDTGEFKSIDKSGVILFVDILLSILIGLIAASLGIFIGKNI